MSSVSTQMPQEISQIQNQLQDDNNAYKENYANALVGDQWDKLLNFESQQQKIEIFAVSSNLNEDQMIKLENILIQLKVVYTIKNQMITLDRAQYEQLHGQIQELFFKSLNVETPIIL